MVRIGPSNQAANARNHQAIQQQQQQIRGKRSSASPGDDVNSTIILCKRFITDIPIPGSE